MTRVGAASLERLGPWVLLGLAAFGVWITGGVAVRGAIAYVLYQVLVVALPGWLVLRMLQPASPGGLRDVAFGWALGYAAVILVFVGGAAIEARWLVWAWPAVAALGAAVAALRRRRGSGGERPPRERETGLSWPVAAVVATGILLVAIAQFPLTPLPGTVDSVRYDSDSLFYLSIATDLAHHFPPASPTLAGLELPYHWFALAHAAAVHELTGIEPAVIGFRLEPVAMTVLLGLALAQAARGFGLRGRWAALPFALVLLAGELDVDPHVRLAFRGLLFEELYADPTTALSLALFVVALALVWERIGVRASAEPRARGPGFWAVLAAVLVALGGAKASALPVLLGGIVLLILWRLLRERRVRRAELYVAGLSAAVLAGLFLTLYAGPRVGTELRLGAGIRHMATVEQLETAHAGVPPPLFWIVVAPTALAALLGPIMAGMLLLADRRSRPAPPTVAFLVGLVVAGLIPFLLVSIASGNEVYFTVYALLAGALAAALGLHGTWQLVERRGSISARTLLLALGSLFMLAALTGLVRADRSAEIDRFAVTSGIVACLVALAAFVGWSLTRSRAVAALFAAGGLAAAGATDSPLDVLPPAVDALQGTPAHSASGRSLTPAVLSGLRWVRENSSEQAILAVNNHYANEEGTDPRAFLYSAFSERRVLIQSWLYTERAHKLGLARVADGLLPYPALTRLNDRAFSGDAAAAGELACLGVDWLVLDRRYEPRTIARELESPAYENEELAVYRLPRGNCPL